MIFLAPWALAVGALAAAGAILLHFIARRPPATVALPTARFIADRRSLVSALVTRPRDLLLLALRVATLLAAAAAFARPVLPPRREPLARVILLDRSAAVAAPQEAVSRVRALLGDGVPARLVAFDSVPTSLPLAASTLDSLAGARPTGRAGSLTAALVAARRTGASLGARADSVQLVLVSPVATSELDEATPLVRAEWRGGVSLIRVALAADTSPPAALERGIALDDPRGPAAATLRVAAGPRAVRLRGAALTAQDSAFARGGGTVVEWDSAGAMAPGALVVGDDVVVATLGRGELKGDGHIVARWADGSPAAQETTLGDGCIRRVVLGLPSAGDLPLRPSFQRAVRRLLAPCREARAYMSADAATTAQLEGGRAAARGSALGGSGEHGTPLVPWLLALAIACAIAELIVRARSAPEAA